MGTAGFRLALNYTSWYGSAADVEAYAAEAQTDGVKLIWPLDYPAWRDAGSATTLLSTYSKLAADCGCSSNAGFLQYVIGLVRSLPATWGYYIGDELSPADAPAVAALAAKVRKLDPGHPLLYVAMASSNLSTNLQPFESIANTVGADVYPIGTGESPSAVGPVASTVGQLSRSNGTSAAMVLQAFSWTEYPGQVKTVNPAWPTEAQMQAMRDQALTAANPSMVLWYSIYDILRSDDPVGHWRDLVQAAFAPLPAAQPAARVARTRTTRRRRRVLRARTASLRRHHRRHRDRHRRRGHHRRRHHRHNHHRRRSRRSQPLLSRAEPLLNFLRSLLVF